MVQTRYEPVKPKKKIEENKINLHIRKKNSNFAGEYTQNVFQRKIHPYFKIKMDMETLHENADITLKSEESCTAIENEKKPKRTFSKISKSIAWLSLCAIVGILAVGAYGWYTGKWNDDKALEHYLVFVFCIVHILWITSIITMLTQKTAKWLRVMNVAAPLLLNIVIVAGIIINNFYTWKEQLAFGGTAWLIMLGVAYCILAFPIFVWLINTIVVICKR